jgi:hypothetical protein
MTGKPISSAAVTALAASVSRPVPGASATPCASASARALCLRPKASMFSGVGPMKTMPASLQACAKAALSDRNP